MTIETKYNPGDEVYIITNNSIKKDKIIYIDIVRSDGGYIDHTLYSLLNYSIKCSEKTLFSTKEDAIAAFVLNCKDV